MALINQFDALLTTQGRKFHALQDAEGLAWGSYEYQFGGGGFDTLTPTTVLDVDPEATALIDPIGSPAAISGFDRPNPKALAFRVEVPIGSLSFEMGEVGIWATVTYSPLQPLLVGQRFLLALAHFPAFCKNQRLGLVAYVVVQL